jgi:UDPglucose 6-dehydrogenase
MSMNARQVLEQVRKGEVRIAVIGLGHVGLPTALSLAEIGWQVIGVDNSEALVEKIGKGESPFYEPGQQELLTRHIANPKFRITTDIDDAIRSASVIFICVGTPQRENGDPDLKDVEALARKIAKSLNGYKLIIEKSTVPAITGEWIRRTIWRHATNLNVSKESGVHAFDVASNPEFLQEGQAIRNFLHPDRIVCGVNSEIAGKIIKYLYAPLRANILFTSLNTAELIKHAANAFLATKVSFINMVADICEAVGADVTDVATGIGMDPRIAPGFLNAGLGFGGYCLPKDLRAFMRLADNHGVRTPILKATEEVNQHRINVFMRKVQQALWVVENKPVAALGLAFKPGTDDVRDSPGLNVVSRLLREGANVRAYDPAAIENASKVMPPIADRLEYFTDPYEAARGAHAVLLLTEWPEFKTLDLARLRKVMDVPVLIDGRNLFDPRAVVSAGFEYIGMGKKSDPSWSAVRKPSQSRTPAGAKAKGAALAYARPEEEPLPKACASGTTSYAGD